MSEPSYFQILDYKDSCYGIFANNQLYFDSIPDKLDRTWQFHPKLDSEFAEVYVNGKSPGEIAPKHLKELWDSLNEKKESYLRCFKNSKIDLDKHCFYDLVPESFIYEFNFIKNEITKYVFDTFQKPSNYDYLIDLCKLTHKISKQELILEPNKFLIYKLRNSSHSKNIKYNIFGTVTGRFSTYPNSFPILNLKKEYRSMILPKNDMFLELDMNASEIRTFLALLGKEQPKIDIHDWNRTNLFDGDLSRKEAKLRFFSWFYNSNNEDKELENVYNRDYLLQRYFDGNQIQSPFGRQIKTDKFHALSYLVQGASNDIILKNIIKIDNMLENLKSFISLMIHDSVVIDLHSDDIPLIKELYNLFTQTEYGQFLASISVGPNFGEMKCLPLD